MDSFVYYGIAILIIFLTQKLIVFIWWRPKQVEKFFLTQGIRGPSYSPFVGSLGELARIYARATPPPSPTEAHPIHSTLPHVVPHIHQWREIYGNVYLYWYGPSPRIVIMDPQLIKDVISDPAKYSQYIQHPVFYNLLGKSLNVLGGEAWATQRKMLNPLFAMESVKGLSRHVTRAVEERTEAWRNLMGSSNELEIDALKEFQTIAQCVLANAIFGTDDAEEAMHIVHLQSQQAILLAQSVRTFYIPGSRFVPTSFNRTSKRLRQDAERRFKDILKRRERDDSRKEGDDWLSLMLASNMSHEQIMDECCTYTVSGSESTNLVLAWACVLLSMHTQWQDRAREEIRLVLEGSQGQPMSGLVHQFKILGMIINETTRLYPPVCFVAKRAEEDLKYGGMTIPAGTQIEVPIVAVHHDPEQWGDGVDRFDPARFAEGVSKASKHPMAFMPFMHGPRRCIGMNFALMEAKIVLAMILNEFAFTRSPKYKHEPVFGFTLKPGNSAYVVCHKI